MTPTEQEERRLRSLLRAAVPEPPAVDPSPATRPRRRRGPAAAALAAAAAVVAIAVLPPALDGSDRGEPTRGAGGPSPSTSPLRPVNPYQGSCPRSLPPLADADRDLPDLWSVRSVRLCADPDFSLGAPTDALVSAGTVDLAAGVTALPPARPARCAAIDRVALDTSLVLTLDDGGSVTVPTDLCTDLVRGPGDGRPATRVDAAQVAAVFLDALDRQRRSTTYPPVDAEVPPLRCDTPTTQAPVRPTDPISGGVLVCAGTDASPVAVPPEGVEALEEALLRAPEPATTEDVGGYDDELPYLLYRTDHDDVVRLSPVGDGLLLDPWQVGFGLGRSTVVPLDVADVTDP